MSGPSAPPASDSERDDQLLSVAYPMLRELIMREGGAPAPAPARGDAVAASASTSGFAFHAWNTDCMFCRDELAKMTDAVALLPCGHAFHAKCGEGFLWRDSKHACPQASCPGTRAPGATAATTSDTGSGPVAAAGALSKDELDDPVIRRYLMRQKGAAGGAGENAYVPKEIQNALFGASESPQDAHARLRSKWAAEFDGEGKMDLRLKAQIVMPYLTKVPKQVRKIEGNVTLDDLLDLEAEAQAAGKVEQGTRAKRISFERFAYDFELDARDLFFAMNMRHWGDLTDIGFTKDDLTHGDDSEFSVLTLAALYGLDSHNFVRDLGVDMADLVRMRLPAATMRIAGFTFDALDEHFQISKEDVMRLGYTPDEWHHVLGLKKRHLFRPLEINATDLKLLRWNPIICTRVFQLNARDQDELGITELLTATTATKAAAAPLPRRKKKTGVYGSADAAAEPPQHRSVGSMLRTALTPRPMNGHSSSRAESSEPERQQQQQRHPRRGGREPEEDGPVILSLS
jgi:hypothetical protein